METYGYWIFWIFAYLLVSCVLLESNEMFSWIYGSRFFEPVVEIDESLCTQASFKEDPGLNMVFLVIGPVLFLMSLFGFVLWVIKLIVLCSVVLLPRAIINSIAKKLGAEI